MAFETVRLYHQRNYVRIIHIKYESRIVVEQYPRQFIKLIPNIDIDFVLNPPLNYEEKRMIYRFIKLNCSAELKSIRLRTDIMLGSSLTESIKDQIKSVTNLEISCFGSNQANFDNLLKYCENIECLRIHIFLVYFEFNGIRDNLDWL